MLARNRRSRGLAASTASGKHGVVDQGESPKERAARYQKMAQQAASLATETALPQTRQQHLALAKIWFQLAKEAEQEDQKSN